MINYIKRKNLNVKKYDSCVENSLQSRIYAFSWYLDIVADNWDVLVLDDYKAVMPIPWKSKLGLRYITQPYFCQQICVYSNLKINVEAFIDKIPKYFLYVNINCCQKFDEFLTKQKVNYQIKLNTDYNSILNSYRKDRKKSLRKASESNLYYKDYNSIEILISLYKDVFSNISNSNKYFIIIKELMMFSLQNDKGFIRNIFINDKLICSGFFVKYKSRIYYLFAASNALGKKYGATTFLIDSVLKEYVNTDFIFDFEGSTIPNVANFYKSFGGEKTIYFNLKANVFKRVFL